MAELTGHVSLDAWPEGARLIFRRERPHPGAQLSSPTTTGTASSALSPTRTAMIWPPWNSDTASTPSSKIASATLKSTGLSNLPFSAFAPNQAWLEAALVAHDLTVWTQLLLFDGDHPVCEPKRLRYRLLHVAGTPHPPRPPAHAAPAGRLALGRRHRPSVQAPRRAARLTARPSPTTTLSIPARAGTSSLLAPQLRPLR